MSIHQNRRERRFESAAAIPASAPLASSPAHRHAALPANITARSDGSHLDSATRSFLEPRLGHNLGNVRIYSDAQADRLSKDYDAAAFTVGQDIFFARGNYDPDSAMGRRLLTHEVTHTVQQRGTRPGQIHSGGLDVAGRHSGSEIEAHAATDAVMRGDSVRLSASPGPVISRWESGEHKRSVDEAIQNLPPGQQVDPAVAAQMTAKIKLANGLEVTPGHITAMMGDLYGKFDEKGNFDPKASFDQLNNADPEEMAALMKVIDEEAKTGKPADASEFEKITRNRRDGEGSYLELAQKNNSHFSAPTAEGTNNNMGAYSAFHKMALEAAERGDMETARAMEASGGHFLTDRFAAGHNFEKAGALEASGRDPTGVLANMAVKTAHDDMNDNGIAVKDAKGAPGWTAYGDGNWDRDENKENRQHTAQAVYGSWSELQKVGSGKSNAAEVEKGGFDALKSVPQWDPKNQERAEAVARNTSIPGMLWDYGGELPDALIGKFWRAEGKVENAVGDAWDWTKDKAGDAWDWTKDKAGDAWDWTKDKASDAWDWTKETASDAADWVGDKASDAWDTAGDAADWVGDKAGDAYDWAGDKVSAGVDAVEDAGSWVGGKAKSAWNWATDW